jgi:hypothetical protein
LKLTAVAPVRLLPLIVTVVPMGPPLGAKESIAGGGVLEVPVVKW